jgi:hypothetical protein
VRAAKSAPKSRPTPLTGIPDRRGLACFGVKSGTRSNRALSARQAQYRRLAGRRGKKRALVAVGHTILVACWHMISNEVDSQDLGPTHLTKLILGRLAADRSQPH